MSEKKRLYVGGLFEEVTENDLMSKFSMFGNISGIDIRLQKDLTGVNSGSKTFAYLDMTLTGDDLKKCMSMYNKTRWKGRELKIQLAKESFLDRLKREREGLELQPDQVKPKKVKSTSAVFHDPFKDKSDLDKETMTVRGAAPGTELSGEKDWVVGKYGRVLPVVNIRQRDKKKLMRVDPSKQCHQVTRLKDDQVPDQCPVQSLTWEMDTEDSEATKKRKGAFESWTPKAKSPKKKCAMKEDGVNSGLDIVSKDLRSSVKLVRAQDDVTKKLSKSKAKGGMKSQSNIAEDDLHVENGNDSSSSADTDELLSTGQPSYTSPGLPSSQSKHSFISREYKTLEKITDTKAKDELHTKPSKSHSGVEVVSGAKKKRAISMSDEEVVEDVDSDIEAFVKQEKEREKEVSSSYPLVDEEFEIVPVDLSSQNNNIQTGHAGIDMAKFSDGESSDSASFDSDDRRVVNHEFVKAGVSDKKKKKRVKDKKPEASSSEKMSEKMSVNSTKYVKKMEPEVGSANKQTTNAAGGSTSARNKSPGGINCSDSKPAGGSRSRESKTPTIEEKHRGDNQKRLDALKQRQKETENKKRAIQQALAAVDSGAGLNKHMVFDSDSDGEESTEPCVQHSSITKTLPQDTARVPSIERGRSEKTSALFNDDSGSSDSSDSEEDRFRLRPQFEGRTGQKLMQLQGRFGNDSRFRLDERFQDSDNEEEDASAKADEIREEESSLTTGAVVDDGLETERKKALEILKNVVGEKSVLHSNKSNKKTSSFTDKSGVRYDPSRQEHKQFEVKKDAMTLTRKEKPQNANENRTESRQEETDGDQVPEVSKEQFFEVTTSLKDVFSNRNEEAFSFLGNSESPIEASIGSEKGNAERVVNTKASILPNPYSWQQQNFCFTNSDDGEGEDSDKEPDGEKSETRKKNTETVPSLSSADKTFFFVDNDRRLQEGVAFFHRQEDIEELKEKWNEKKPSLIEDYRMKRKKTLRRNKLTNSLRKKRFVQRPIKSKH